MSGPVGGWLRRLQPEGDETVRPVTGTAPIERATRVIGEGPVQWAVERGLAMARIIVAEMPEFGETPDALELLRTGTEAVSLQSLLVLAGASDDRPGPPEALEGVADFVRHGIGLDAVLRGIRLSHAEMLRGLLAECERLVPPEERLEEAKRASDASFVYVDAFSAAMTEQYIADQVRWSTSELAARREVVLQVLREPSTDVDVASDRLGYPLAAGHQALVLWSTAAAADGAVELQRVAGDLIRRGRAQRSLLLPVSAGTVWAWAGTDRDLAALRGDVVALPAHVHVAIGRREAGAEGFRRSHAQAVAASELARSLAAPGQVVRYADVELLSLLLEDRDRAAGFAAHVLGPLWAATEQAADLRETLLAYLEEQGSTQATARRLHLARNTVTYRIHRIEEALGAPVAGRVLELHAALRVADAIRPGRSRLGGAEVLR